MCVYGIWPYLFSHPISIFLQLLSAYYAPVVFLSLFIFFLFPVCCASEFLVINLVEYSGKHDISFLTSEAKARMQKIFLCFE